MAKTTHKLGLKLPYCVEEAYIIDLKNGNSAFWWEAMRKGMRNIMVSFDILNDNIKDTQSISVFRSLFIFEHQDGLDLKLIGCGWTEDTWLH